MNTEFHNTMLLQNSIEQTDLSELLDMEIDTKAKSADNKVDNGNKSKKCTTKSDDDGSRDKNSSQETFETKVIQNVKQIKVRMPNSGHCGEARHTTDSGQQNDQKDEDGKSVAPMFQNPHAKIKPKTRKNFSFLVWLIRQKGYENLQDVNMVEGYLHYNATDKTRQ